MNSFFPDSINSWNNVIPYFKDIPSIGILRNHILSLIRPEKKSTFGIYDSSELRYLFQLRIGLSPLRYHKKRHKFPDTPSDLCICTHGIEDTNHFLFTCPLYATHIVTLMTSVNIIIQKYNLNHLNNQSPLFLYGHRTIDFADNTIIILSTIKYIKDTKRFSS